MLNDMLSQSKLTDRHLVKSCLCAQSVHSVGLRLITTHKVDNDEDSLPPQLSVPVVADAAVGLLKSPGEIRSSSTYCI